MVNDSQLGGRPVLEREGSACEVEELGARRLQSGV